MKTCYVVTETSGEYSQTYFQVKAVFTTRALAEDYVAKMAALPGITAEYGPGDRNDYDIEEMPIWDEETERMMLFHCMEYIAPGEKPQMRGYRSEEYAPEGYQGFYTARRQWEPETGWSDIRVTESSRERLQAKYDELLNTDA